MAADDSFIRLVNLFELLTNTERPLTMDEIYQSLPGLPVGESARRQAVERAKSALKSIGIPLRSEMTGAREPGYIVRREDLELDVDLTEDERSALSFTLGCLDPSTARFRTTAEKLGVLTGRSEGVHVEIAPSSLIPVILSAVELSQMVELSYRGQYRKLCPYGLLQKWGRWYLVATYPKHDGVRTFRLDRIESTVSLVEEFFERDNSINLQEALPERPSEIEINEAESVRVVADRYGEAELRTAFEVAGSSLRPGGLVALELSVVNTSALVEAVLPLGSHAIVEGPTVILDRVRSWLLACLEQEDVSNGEPKEVVRTAEPTTPREVVSSTAALRRFQLLESILPTLANLRKVSLSDLARQHRIGVGELVSLLESASLCGVPPYSPDALYEILVDPDEDLIEVRLDSALSRPRRFDYAEAVLALSVARTILASTDTELPALSSAIEKLSRAFGSYLQAIESVAVEVPTLPELPNLRRALIEERDVEIVYRSGSSQEASLRRVTPLRLFSEDGAWYLRGFCHRALALRVFNVARVESVTTLEDRTLHRESKEWDESMQEEQALGPDGFVGELKSALVWVDERGWQLLDSLPKRLVELLGTEGNARLARVYFYSESWLESLVLRASRHLWPHRKERWLYDLRSQVVHRVLALYEQVG